MIFKTSPNKYEIFFKIFRMYDVEIEVVCQCEARSDSLGIGANERHCSILACE